MKATKIAIIATAITCAIIFSCALLVPACAEHGEFYPKLTVVTALDRVGNSTLFVVTCTDQNGDEWGFYEEERLWAIGDICNLMMWEINEREEDDEVVEVYWEGHTDDINGYFRMMGWR